MLIQAGFYRVWQKLKWLALGGALCLGACQQPAEDVSEPLPVAPEPVLLPSQLDLIPAHWDAMSGWGESDLRPALSAFLRSCETFSGRSDDAPLNPRAAWAGRIGEWRAACTGLAMTEDTPEAALASFEALFSPVRVVAIEPDSQSVEQTGLLTGYYEPFVEVRETRQGAFTQPLRLRPDDLISVNLGDFDEELAGRSLVGRAESGRLVHYRDRAEIENRNAGEVFAWGRPIDVFFLQIQGSGRLVFEDESQIRAAFSAHNGLPYRSIGRELIARGELELHAASKAGIENWLNENGPEATAELFSVNPRYVFFAQEALDQPELGPRGSSGVALTPISSMAIDPAFHAHGVPVWLNADLPEAPLWSGLVIAQDSGGAITGPLRGDFFWGWGEDAERRAGTTRAQSSWTVLLPNAVVDRIADATPPA